MTKRLFNVATYKIKTNRGIYAVCMERLKNTTCGNPRFTARIVTLEIFDEKFINDDFLFTSHYNFNGHFMNELDEARWIVNRYEMDILKD